MGLIKIYSQSGVEIEYQKNSLTLKKENNSMSSDFKVPHSSFPFLVLENENTKKTLGPSDITSIRKNKIIPVIIIENGVRYYGELQQLSVLPKFRKCNLKFGSSLLAIINKKIGEFFPVVSVIPGETNPVPFTEESTQIVSGSDNWETYPVSMIGQIYPEAKFNFPTMAWRNKFGIDLTVDDVWYNYEDYINKFIVNASNQTVFVKNVLTISGATSSAQNKNIPAPQLFLLSPLYYIFKSINFKILGDFPSNEFIKKVLLLNNVNNISKTYIQKLSVTNITLANIVFNNSFYSSFTTINTPYAGRYVFNKSFTEPFFNTSNTPNVNSKSFSVIFKGVVYGFYNHILGTPQTTYADQFVIEVESADVGLPIHVFYKSPIPHFNLPAYQFNYMITSLEQQYQQMHPTIDLKRYAPEWTVGNYLNYIKNQFNLDITIDDSRKEVVLNFNENISENEIPAIVTQSLAMNSYDLAANTSFVIKYDNDLDASLFVDKNQVVLFSNQDDDYTKFLKSKFKKVPTNGNTSELSDELMEKQGIGLMIYEPTAAPNTSIVANGLHLDINGAGGIYDTYFKKWIKFLLNASYCEITGYFTQQEVEKITRSKSVYINNQRFRVIDLEATDSVNLYQEVKMNLASVNY